MAYYMAGPFNFTISNNSANTNSITGAPGSNDGKLCLRYIDSTMVTLYKVFPEARSISNPARGRAVAWPCQILHFCTEVADTYQLLPSSG